MKRITKTFYYCGICDASHENEDDALICEQFCTISDSTMDKIDPDKFSMAEKRKFVKEMALAFRKLWDEDGSHRDYYGKLASE